MQDVFGSAGLGTFGSAALEILGWAELKILGSAAPLASFVAGRFVDCMIVTGRLATFDGVLVANDRILGYHHKETAVHRLHCSRVPHGMARKTGTAGFRFSLQEALLCRLLWTARIRNRLPRTAISNACRQTREIR